MIRFTLVLAALAVGIIWVGPVAFAQQDDFQLPPVKLKPDRPTTTKPIPPTPDDRNPPAPPKEVTPPAEPPKEVTPPAEPPKEVTPPAPPKEVVPPAEPPKEVTPPAPPKEVVPPAEPPKEVAPPAPPKEVTPPAFPPPPEIPPPAPPKEVAPPIAPPKEPAPLTPSDFPPPQAPPAEMPAPVLAAPKSTTPKAEKPAELMPPAEPRPEVRPVEIQKEAAEAQVAAPATPDLTGMGEVGLVEEVARARKAYERALTALKDFYLARSTVHKIEWASSELDAYTKVPKIQYLTVAEVAGPDLHPSRRVDAADQLYAEGLHYKDYPAFPPGKKDYLKIALEKFQTIIEKYPQSDKIADAAFRMGEIYGGWYFEDWARAVSAYERCWQWDPKTQHPAFFNAAKIYDERLKNRTKAVELYNRVVIESGNQDHVKQAVERLKALTGK